MYKSLGHLLCAQKGERSGEDHGDYGAFVKMTENFYYFDTQIWIDHYLKRGPDGMYGDYALKLIFKAIAHDSKIIFSNFNEREMKAIGLSVVEIHSLLSMIKPDHIKHVSVTKVQFEEARRIAKQRDVPLGDAIHAILARDYEAILVTRDEKDFRKLKDITRYKEPADVIYSGGA